LSANLIRAGEDGVSGELGSPLKVVYAEKDVPATVVPVKCRLWQNAFMIGAFGQLTGLDLQRQSGA